MKVLLHAIGEALYCVGREGGVERLYRPNPQHDAKVLNYDSFVCTAQNEQTDFCSHFIYTRLYSLDKTEM
jgi:hypothetical protein